MSRNTNGQWRIYRVEGATAINFSGGKNVLFVLLRHCCKSITVDETKTRDSFQFPRTGIKILNGFHTAEDKMLEKKFPESQDKTYVYT